MTKYTEKQIIEACELREAGLTYGGIAKKIGMHKASVLEYCQERGAVSPKLTKVWAAPTFTPEIDALLLAMRQRGVRLAHMARALDRPEKSVRNRVRALAFNEAKIEAAGA